MSRDMISDFLTIIRNGIEARKRLVEISSSNMRVKIAEVLKEEGYIRDFAIEQDKASSFPVLRISLKYVNGESAIHELKRISKLSRRCYQKSKNIIPVVGGLGISVVTTNRGVMTGSHAKKLGIGGEVICHVW